MKLRLIAVAGILGFGLAACEKSPSDKLADRVEDAADARAEVIENKAEVSLEKARDIRATGQERSNAIDAANRDDATMTQKQRDAIVANETAAVR